MSDDNELVASVIDIVKVITRTEDITLNTEQEGVPEWDSLAYMSIVSEIESKYKVSITHENIGKFYSVKSIVSLIKN